MAPSKTPIKIIIADDHPIFLDSLKRAIDKIPEFKLVGVASDGQQLIELSIKLKPDIIITDILMPGTNGIEATKQLTKELPGVAIIALSVVEKESLIIDMLEAGAKGYLLKNAHIDEVVIAVNTVLKNQKYFSIDISTYVTEMVADGNYFTYRNIKSLFSEREINIIKLICEEKSNKQIAGHLGITKRAVEGIRDQILKKTGAKNSIGIAMFAMRNKIVE